MKLPFFQYFRNRVKDSQQGDIFMLTDKGVMRHGLLALDKVMEAYASKGRFEASIELVGDIFDGRISSTEPQRVAVSYWAPMLVKGYLSQQVFEGQLTEDKVRVLSTVLDCLIVCKQVDPIFEDVRPVFPPKMFWEEIAKRVRSGQLTDIPYDYLSSGLQYLDNDELIRLLKNFDPKKQADDDIAINKVLMIIKKKNIWPYLYKFCVYYPTQSIPLFLTMLAAEILMMDKKAKESIINEASWTNPESLDLDVYFQDENRRLFFRIFWFFNLVLAPEELEKSLHHFSPDAASLNKNIPDIYAKTLEWILDGNNVKIVVETSMHMFFELIYYAVLNLNLLKTSKVVEVVRKIKNIFLKKIDQGAGLKFVGSMRATQSLNFEGYPFSVAENICMILEEVLGAKYRQDLAFTAVKLLHFGTHARKFENQEWICYTLLSVLSEIFTEGRFWLDFQPLSLERFEDLVINVCSKLENRGKDAEENKKLICSQAYDKR